MPVSLTVTLSNNMLLCRTTGLSSLGVPGVPWLPWHPQIMADQLTLSQPGGEDYTHHINTGTPGFSDLPTALHKESFP